MGDSSRRRHILTTFSAILSIYSISHLQVVQHVEFDNTTGIRDVPD